MQRTLKVGRQTIGLIGLDIALSRIKNSPGYDSDTAATQVYTEIATKNQAVPPTLDIRHKGRRRAVLLPNTRQTLASKALRHLPVLFSAGMGRGIELRKGECATRTILGAQ